MKKCEVKEYFTLKKFDELKNLVRADENNNAKDGELFVGDTFDCTEEMCNYLNGDNKYNKSYINVIGENKEEANEEPKEEKVIEEKTDVVAEEPKEEKKENKKTSKK